MLRPDTDPRNVVPESRHILALRHESSADPHRKQSQAHPADLPRREAKVRRKHQQSQAGDSDAAIHTAPIVGSALPVDELLVFQPVDEPRDPGSLLDHSGGNLQSGQSLGAGTAENAQDVVLLSGDALLFDGGVQVAPKHIGGA